MDYKSVVYNAARDGNLNRLKVRKIYYKDYIVDATTLFISSRGKRTMDERITIVLLHIIICV